MKTEQIYKEPENKMFRPDDNQTIISVENANGFSVKFYDEGYGPLFLWHSQLGNFSFLAGVIRAPKLHEAYDILCDQFLPECDMSMDEIIDEYGEGFSENESFCNEYGFRPNGPNSSDKHGHGIYQLDWSNEYLSKANGDITGLTIKYRTEE
jgi:hypothetical protein